mmetsp:Transcript_47662/g.102066  ORF Transcript_47662/g.102066 Transcript_47662/m.102066 type:complete len:472 (+) Transcript_47662:66-1481(+)
MSILKLVAWLCTIGLIPPVAALILDLQASSKLRLLHPIEQVHLAATKSFDKVVVAYASKVRSDTPFVAYRIDSADEWRQVRGTWLSFEQDNPNGVPNLYRATLSGLPSKRKVHYKACINADDGNNIDLLCSEEYTFTTLGNMASPGHSSTPTRILFVADLGSGINSIGQELMTALPSLEKEVLFGSGADAVFHMGDMAYDLHSDGGARGDLFMRRLEPVSARTFYQTVPGNHERMANDTFAQYQARFHMPAESNQGATRSSETSPFKLWWSADINGVHVAGLNTEVFHNASEGVAEEMMAWLRQDLITANRRRHLQPWVVLLGHRPSYCSEPDGWCKRMGTTGPAFRDEFESLLYEQQVDLALWGHQHVYERSWPVFNRTVAAKHYHNSAAPVHIVTGAGGNTDDFMAMSMEAVLQPDGEWSAFLDAGRVHFCSYGRLLAANSTHLQVEQVNGITGSIMDEFWIVKDKRKI